MKTLAARDRVGQVERLEPRALLAGFVLEGSVLTVEGSDGDDRIAATVAGSGGDATLSIWLNSSSRSYAVSAVNAVVLRGMGGNDRIIGSDLAETIEGGDGQDTLDGGRGADLLKGGGGRDVLSYATRTANLSVALDGQVGDGEAGENDNAWYDIETVVAGSGRDFVSGTGAANLLIGNGGDDTIRGSGGSDTILGGDGSDLLNGGSGDDLLEGGVTPGDTLDGSDGDDTLLAGGGIAGLRGMMQGDSLIGGPGIDRLRGGIGADHMSGGEVPEGTISLSPDGVLVIRGSDGPDEIGIGPSFDGLTRRLYIHVNGLAAPYLIDDPDVPLTMVSVIAGSGDDEVYFTDSDSADVFDGRVVVDGGGGNDYVWLYDQERLTLIGGDGDDMIYRIGPFLDIAEEFLDGGPGVDTLACPVNNLDLRSFPTVENGAELGGTAYGNDLDNVLTAQWGTQVTLYGLGGNDMLEGGHFSDVLDGGEGADVLRGEGGADVLRGGGGHDAVDYSARTANLTISINDVADDGEAGERDNVRTDIERIISGSGHDLILGTNAPNVIFGGRGLDTIFGYGGDDRLVGGSHSDRMNGGLGSDTLTGEQGRDVLTGGPGRDRLLGGSDDDTFYGRDGEIDSLFGDSGFDRADTDAQDLLDQIEGTVNSA